MYFCSLGSAPTLEKWGKALFDLHEGRREADKIESLFCIYFHTMWFLLFLSLASAYRIETVTTDCIFVDKNCFNWHAKKVEAEINKPDNKDQYIYHTTSMHKYGAASMITYK